MDIDELNYGLWILGGSGRNDIFEARAIGPSLPTIQAWGQSKMFVSWHAYHAGKQYNFYIGRNPRRENGLSKDIDIDETNAFTIDIDPIRLDKTKPATDDEQCVTILAARDAVSYLGCGAILETGNGCQVWCKLDTIDLRGRRAWWKSGCDKLESDIAKRLVAYPVVVDKTQDIARLVKMPGTVSLKGMSDSTHPYREVRFSVHDHDIKLDAEWIMGLADDASETITKNVTLPTIVVPQRFFDVIARDKELRDAWLHQRTDLSRGPSESTSEQDMALVSRLRRWNFSKEEAAAILRQAPHSKAREREDYVALTIAKAYGV